MSKLDAQRAMREARYAERSRPAKVASAPVTPVAPARVRPATPPRPTEAVVPDARCGHRAISGRICTREQGHAAKSHRYS